MSDAIVITGIGMRTPVGNDTVQSCASLRAGIARFAEWPHLGIGPSEGGVVVAALDPELGDLPWPEKAEDMSPQPLHEALWQAQLYDGTSVARIGAYLALPAPIDGRVEPDALRLFAVEAKKHCISPARADRVELLCLDHASTAAAIACAVEALSSNAIGAAIVGAMDSHLSSTWLQRLHGDKRLKHDGSGVGFVPGEAGVFLVLERETSARDRGAKALARIVSIGLDREPVMPARGDALTRAIRACLEASGGGRDIERVISDVNGERWRSSEYSVIATRCLTGLAPGFQHWIPADCIGDTGAASGAIAIAMAARGFERNYAGQGGVLILSSSPTGERGAIVVARA